MPTNDAHDLELLLCSKVPLVVIESHEEPRVVELLQRMGIGLGKALFLWSCTEGLQRVDFEGSPQRNTAEPTECLRQIKATTSPGIYVLADFHPFLDDPVHVRLLKEIAFRHDEVAHTIILISHSLETPPELYNLTARFDLSLPDTKALERIIHEEATAWSNENKNARVKTDRKTLTQLVNNLSGLTVSDARRLARGAIRDDGAITESDIPSVQDAKHQLMNRTGALSYEYDTARFSDVGGLSKLKEWLKRRQRAFLEKDEQLDPPKGILLVGVQGGGKSLAAKAVAGLWHIPLLRLDFGTLYNKFFGESEKNLREAIKTAEVMSPCVLWVDEIEKALAQSDQDGGVSKRMLGTLLTWMAENKKPVFIVATANAIDQLPPELIRKGRLDEIFFVDLPDSEVRAEIFDIHLKRRDLDPDQFDLSKLADASHGFSGAEIEQAIVSALYMAKEHKVRLTTDLLLAEIGQTRPLSVVMSERIDSLRAWADGRTVPAN